MNSIAHLGRKDWPGKLKNSKTLKLKSVESHKLQHDSVTAVVWHNKCAVLLISTNSNLRSHEVEKKKAGGSKDKVKIPCSTSVANCVLSVEVVNLSDKLCES